MSSLLIPTSLRKAQCLSFASWKATVARMCHLSGLLPCHIPSGAALHTLSVGVGGEAGHSIFPWSTGLLAGEIWEWSMSLVSQPLFSKKMVAVGEFHRKG